jgi:putative SOS response-associated peptidase YedK
MCGRYVSVAEKADLVELYQATAPDPLPAPSYNVAPTQQVTAVIETRDPGGERDRRLKPVKWGLIPSWATDPKIGSRLINARQEGLAEIIWGQPVDRPFRRGCRFLAREGRLLGPACSG